MVCVRASCVAVKRNLPALFILYVLKICLLILYHKILNLSAEYFMADV